MVRGSARACWGIGAGQGARRNIGRVCGEQTWGIRSWCRARLGGTRSRKHARRCTPSSRPAPAPSPDTRQPQAHHPDAHTRLARARWT
eukprot:1467852-Rhodomonas_salina.1